MGSEGNLEEAGSGMNQSVILTCGIPASGKSTWAREWVAEDPFNRARINKDAIRALVNESKWTKDYEKMITAMQRAMVKEALLSGKSVVLDNTNIGPQYVKDVIKLVYELNISATVSEKPFYCELETAIERDSKREGAAKVGEAVIRRFYKQSGGESFKEYQPRVATIEARPKCEAPKHDPSLPNSVVIDLDGTLARIGNRSPYDAKDCDLIDFPNEHVVDVVQAMFDYYSHNLVFCSGREDKHEPETRRFIEKHLQGAGGSYELYMRKTGDTRPDDVVKEEIYREKLAGKVNVKAVIDDRLKVCKMWHRLGLPLFRVGDPEADF